MAQTTTPPASALGAGGVAGLSNQELGAELTDVFRVRAMADGRIMACVAKVEQEEVFRLDGATSIEAWLAERFGVSVATARAYTSVGRKAAHLPHLVEALCKGDITLDKLRAVVDIATPKTDRALCDQAREYSVRELVDIVQTETARAKAASVLPSRSEHDNRSMRFNDAHRTITAQLPTESYAEAKACIDAQIRDSPDDKESPLDQRRCDGFMGIIASAREGSSKPGATRSPYFVVAHVPLDALVDDSGNASDLAGDLERGGLIDRETVKRIACDATVAVAVDDEVGHTMYEGRAVRFATPAQRREVMRRDRHCRFPGCSNVIFAHVHHIVPWDPGGLTNLDNLVLMCTHHHGVVHRNGWSMTGNPNEELTIVGPTGRVMVSRPSPSWNRVTAPRGRAPTS